MLRDEASIKQPSAGCLSPAGEYNMRLGVLKELQPRLIATYTEKAGSYEGHPFIVEAAVSVGGEKLREGINVYRFANRIPLLFESGSDVVTQVATVLFVATVGPTYMIVLEITHFLWRQRWR